MTTTIVASAQSQFEAAQARARELEQQFHATRRQRQAALDDNDQAKAARLNNDISLLNIELRLALSHAEDCRQLIDVAKNNERRIRNAVANLSNEESRIAAALREHEERVAELTPQLARVREQLGEARRALSLVEPEPAPAAPTSVAPAPAQPAEKEPAYPMPHRVVGAGRIDAQYFTREGVRCDAFGRPLRGGVMAVSPIK